MEHVPYSVETLSYFVEYVTRVTYTFRAMYGPTVLKISKNEENKTMK